MTKKLQPDERRAQIIGAALKMFQHKGYDKTTVSDIIQQAGISKGGFYHHYESKEQLLEDVARMFVGAVVAIAQEIAQRDDLSALEKTNAYLRQINEHKKDRTAEVAALLSQMYAGKKNMQLEQLIFGYGQELIAPIMKAIIAQGIEEGDFKTDYPEEAAEVYVRLFLIHQRSVAEFFVKTLSERSGENLEDIFEVIRRKYGFLQETLESVLGLERGSLVLEEIAEDAIDNIGKLIYRGFTQQP